MKRLKRSPERFDVLDLFARVTREDGLDFGSESSPDEVARKFASSIGLIRQIPTAVHGRRIQELFAYVAASLGSTTLIKAEDTGDIISDDAGIVVPDYRLVLVDRSQLLVEVKNCHSRSPKKAVRLTPRYLAGLAEYGTLTNAPVFIAVYWSSWNLWTLTPVEDVPADGLTLLSAALRNRMAMLGDEVLGTKAPLTFRVVTDPTAPRDLQANGRVEFRIGGVELYCAGVPITDKAERHLALQLILFGEWPETSTDVKLDGASVVHVDYDFAPHETTPGQGFEVIGHHSSLVSRRFHLLTTKDHAVTTVSPADDPGSLGLGIPDNYASKALPLWRLRVTPTPARRD